MRVLIIGCGYLGTALGQRLAGSGHQVWGLRRSSGSVDELRALGVEPWVADVTNPATLPPLGAGFDWVINALSSRGGGAEAYEKIYLQGTRNILEWMSVRPPKRYVHVSSTSVYGQTDGSEVTEVSPTEPANETSRILVSTEQLLLKATRTQDWPSIVLRAAGIYGPGRGHLFLQYLRDEATLTGEGERWLNMIHRDDLATAVQAALLRGVPGEIYNAADDESVTESTFYAWLARTLRRPMPPRVEIGAKIRKRGATHKRVSNARLKNDLGCSLAYPTFREGYLAEIHRLKLLDPGAKECD